jgi:hypothetical protein
MVCHPWFFGILGRFLMLLVWEDLADSRPNVSFCLSFFLHALNSTSKQKGGEWAEK